MIYSKLISTKMNKETLGHIPTLPASPKRPNLTKSDVALWGTSIWGGDEVPSLDLSGLFILRRTFACSGSDGDGVIRGLPPKNIAEAT